MDYKALTGPDIFLPILSENVQTYSSKERPQVTNSLSRQWYDN